VREGRGGGCKSKKRGRGRRGRGGKRGREKMERKWGWEGH